MKEISLHSPERLEERLNTSTTSTVQSLVETERMEILDNFTDVALPGDAAALLRTGSIFARTTNGVSQTVLHNSAIDLERTEAFSIMAKARLTADPATCDPDSVFTLFEKGTMADNGASYGMALRPGAGNVDIWMQSAQGNRERIYWRAPLTVDLQQWHTFLLTSEGKGAGGLKVYVDGTQLEASYIEDNLDSSIRTQEPLTIGEGMSSLARVFIPGEIRDVSVLKRTVTPQELQVVAKIPEAVPVSASASAALVDSSAPALSSLPSDTILLSQAGQVFTRLSNGISLTTQHSAAVDIERTDPFSITAQARLTEDPSGFDPDSIFTLVEKGNMATNGASFGMALRPGMSTLDAWVQSIKGNSERIYWRAPLTMDLQQWHTYLLTSDGSGSLKGIKVYIDGKELLPTYGEDTLNSSIRSTEPVTIGEGMSENTRVFIPGEIREAGLLRRAVRPEDLHADALPPAPEKAIEWETVMPVISLSPHPDGIAFAYTHIPVGISLRFDTAAGSQILSFAKGTGTTVIPLPYVNGPHTGSITAFRTDTGERLSGGISFNHSGTHYDDLAKGWEIKQAVYTIEKGTNPDANISIVPCQYTLAPLGREISAQFASNAIEKLGLAFSSTRDLAALHAPELFGATANEDGTVLRRLATEAAARNGSQIGQEENALRDQIFSLFHSIDEAKEKGWQMLLGELQNAFDRVLKEKIGLPAASGSILPRMSGDENVFRYLLAKDARGQIIYAHDEARMLSAVRAHFEELYQMHCHFRGEQTAVQQHEANVEQIAAQAVIAAREGSSIASRADLLAAIDRAVAAGRITIAQRAQMVLAMNGVETIVAVAEKVATAGVSDGGTVGGVIVHRSTEEEQKNMFHSAMGWMTADGQRQLHDLGIDVRTDTLAGKLFVGLFQQLSTNADFSQNLAVSNTVAKVTDMKTEDILRTAWITSQERRTPKAIAEELHALFHRGQYRNIFNAQENGPVSVQLAAANKPNYTDADSFVRIRFDVNSQNYHHANAYLVIDGVKNPAALTLELHDTLFIDIPMVAITSKLGSRTSAHVQVVIQLMTMDNVALTFENGGGKVSDGFIVESTGLRAIVSKDGDPLTESQRQQVQEALDMGDISKLPETNRLIIEKLLNSYIQTGELKYDMYSDSGVSFELESSKIHDGGQCKSWVQGTILESILGEKVARNDLENPGHWLEDTTGKVTEIARSDTGGLGSAIQSAMSGDIVQMQYNETIHTMIIGKITEDGVWVFDSNWANSKFLTDNNGDFILDIDGNKILLPPDETVRYHLFSFDDLNKFVSSFSIYHLRA